VPEALLFQKPRTLNSCLPALQVLLDHKLETSGIARRLATQATGAVADCSVMCYPWDCIAMVSMLFELNYTFNSLYEVADGEEHC
jgi:hypothetical protein